MIKRAIYFILFFTSVCNIVFAQINLVPNPDFEQYSICPNGQGQINRAIPWFNPTISSPDYLNKCNDSIGNGLLGVPGNYFGFEPARSGVAYAGVITGTSGDIREYISTQLNETLLAGQRYRVKFYVSLPDSMWTCNNSLGVYFSNNALSSTNQFNLPYIPQITNQFSNTLDSKVGWTKIEDSFIAIGGENYITIGNFLDDISSDTIFVGGGGTFPYHLSYYYIDDVSVVLDSNTGINDLEFDKLISVFPNPFIDNITLSIKEGFENELVIQIYNLYGEMTHSKKLVEKDSKINFSEMSSGVYILRIVGSDYILNKQIIKY